MICAHRPPPELDVADLRVCHNPRAGNLAPLIQAVECTPPLLLSQLRRQAGDADCLASKRVVQHAAGALLLFSTKDVARQPISTVN